MAAQILLTHEDVADRGRYLNARGTLKALLEFGVVPVVNENDTVATDEIRLGDNDTLGALTVNLTEADLLVLLTDQEGLYDADPRLVPNAALVSDASLTDTRLAGMAGDRQGAKIGPASCRGRECQYVWILVAACAYKKKKK